MSYVDQLKPLHVESNAKTTDTKESKKRPPDSLITNVDRAQSSSASTIVNTASHIIGPTPPSKPAPPVKRRPRRDSSDRNYYEGVALNEEVNILFGDKKKDDTPSVSKMHLFNFLLMMCLYV